jgi:transcriptional regulator with XRE-family HTH domain
MLMVEPIDVLGRRVRQLREAKGMSQQALATAAGLSISVVTKLEGGTMADPRTSTLVALARGLSCTTDDLLQPPAATDPPARRRNRRKGE